jgi:hypothetical protein
MKKARLNPRRQNCGYNGLSRGNSFRSKLSSKASFRWCVRACPRPRRARTRAALIQESDPHFWSSKASVSYDFGVARLATTLLTVTTLSGWRSRGVVTAKFSGQVVAFRSSPTVLAETPVDCSALTPIRSGRPPRARWSAATFFGLYRMRTSPIRQALASFATRPAISTSPVLVPRNGTGRSGSASGRGGRGGGGLGFGFGG